MNNKKIYIIAAIAAVAGFAGCSNEDSTNTNDPVEESVVQEAQVEWEATSAEEKAETCQWLAMLGPESAFAILNEAKEDGKSEQDVRDLIDYVQGECE